MTQQFYSRVHIWKKPQNINSKQYMHHNQRL